MKKIFLMFFLLSMQMAIFADVPNKQKAPLEFNQDKLYIAIPASQSQFTIRLKSNPTTGYTWFLREYNPAIITPIKHEYVPGKKELLGEPGHELWTFQIRPEGFKVPQQTVLRFVYIRPWESNDNLNQLIFHISTQPENK